MTLPVTGLVGMPVWDGRGEAVPPAGSSGERDAMAQWHRLEAHADMPTQTLAYAAALAATMLAGAVFALPLYIDAEGAAALLPLCRDPGVFARWRMIGAREVYEPGDALRSADEAIPGLASQLAMDRRPLAFDRLPAEAPLIAALRSAMRGQGLVVVRPAQASPTIRLGPDWREPESRFNAGRRSDFRRAARRADAFGAVSFEMHSPAPAEFDALFDEAIAVEARSWKSSAGSAIAVDGAKEAFFRQFLKSASERGETRIAMLRIDGRAAAMHLAVESAGSYWLFKIGYDEAYARCSPGTLLMLHAIGDAARRGLGAFELLGEIEPWIAELWTREARPCVSLRTYPYGLRGAAALAVDAIAFLRGRARRA